MVQRKYKIIKDALLKGLTEEVNEQIQREYKDKEGFLYQSSDAGNAWAPLKTVYGIRLGLLVTGGRVGDNPTVWYFRYIKLGYLR